MQTQPTKPVAHYKAGDHVICRGHLYTVVLIITLANGGITYTIRQPHWPNGHVLHVDQSELLVDVPFTA